LELEKDYGSISIGKKANLFITEKIPDYSFLMYSYGENHIEEIILNGEILKRDEQATN